MISSRRISFLLAALLSSTTACTDPVDSDALPEAAEDGELDTSKADGAEVTGVTDDNLNGLWTATVNGVRQADDDVIESWSAIGIRLHARGKTYTLTRAGDRLTGPSVELTIKANQPGVRDDAFEGTIDGASVKLLRDTATKPPINVAFPGDRPFRQWLVETLLPLAQQDRESYVRMESSPMLSFLMSCELYRRGSWLRQYFKGTTPDEREQSFKNVVFAVANMTSTPRQITSNFKFSQALQANLSDPTKIGLAMSSFGMYFTTAAGRSLRMAMTPTSTAYFITDKPKRDNKIGLVVMKTPTHGPLASTFGRQLLDLGAMPASDDTIYARAMMELLVKSDNRTAVRLSATGQSALTDWFAVMAIEDYRGVAFGYPQLGWGYNITNTQFYGLVAKALARPTERDSEGKPVIGQVLVGSELRPGEGSYADVLNSGNDLQEYPDMATLKQHATAFLRERHPQQVTAVEAAFAGVIPIDQAESRARQDIFHFITAQLYDDRTANLQGPAATTAIDAVVTLLDTLRGDSAGFEAYLLAHGITKSNVPAPKSTGF